MTFYGIPDKAKADRVYELLTEIRAIYGDVLKSLLKFVGQASLVDDAILPS